MISSINPNISIIDIEKCPVIFSENALKVINKALSNKTRKNKLLRVSVEGGGCSGFKYGLNFISETDENDILCKYTDIVNIVIDVNSYLCMKNTMIDFVKTNNGSGFTFSNPNSLSACTGCD
jgi:iron-sulfur cluster assembly protein